MNKKKEFDKWLIKNGCCRIDFKNKDILLSDGGLFSIITKKVRRHKVIGYKKLPNGNSQVLFSKNKPIKDIDYEVVVWFEELRETINYLKRLEKFLNKLGYKTKRDYLKWSNFRVVTNRKI